LLFGHHGKRALQDQISEVYHVSISRANPIPRRGNGVMRLMGVACLCFFAGMLFQAHCIHSQPVEAAGSAHLYELMVYHVLPGKAPALESIFQDVSTLQAKHGISAVGYWVPNDDSPEWKDTFVYLVAHPDRQTAETNWNALHTDPVFHPYRVAAAPLIQQKNGNYQVDEVYMRSTDYSRAK
jgi:hypothetical protein